MARTIVITSGKGGVGKTSVSANLSIALSKQGNRVCIIDADLGLKNLDVVFGLENRVIYDIQDVIEKRCTIEKAIVKDKRCPNLYLLPACKSLDVTKINETYLKSVVYQLESIFDFIIIDCPAGIENGFLMAIKSANEAIVVANVDTSSIRDADRVIGLLYKHNITDVKLILNRIKPSHFDNDTAISVEDIVELLSIELIGIVYEDEKLSSANNNGTPIALDENSFSRKCFFNIANRIQGIVTKFEKKPKKNTLKKIFSYN